MPGTPRGHRKQRRPRRKKLFSFVRVTHPPRSPGPPASSILSSLHRGRRAAIFPRTQLVPSGGTRRREPATRTARLTSRGSSGDMGSAWKAPPSPSAPRGSPENPTNVEKKAHLVEILAEIRGPNDLDGKSLNMPFLKPHKAGGLRMAGQEKRRGRTRTRRQRRANQASTQARGDGGSREKT